MPPHLSCPVGAEAPCAAEQTATSSSFPRPTSSHAHRCSQHGGEQSGLVTLTFDLLTLKVMSESHVTWATYMPILVFLDLFSTKARSTRQTDVRRRTDRRQTAPSLNAPPVRGGGITTTVRLCHLRVTKSIYNFRCLVSQLCIATITSTTYQTLSTNTK